MGGKRRKQRTADRRIRILGSTDTELPGRPSLQNNAAADRTTSVQMRSFVKSKESGF
jgi:hypothetical protein